MRSAVTESVGATRARSAITPLGSINVDSNRGMDSSSKAQLTKEICSLSAIFLSCTHRQRAKANPSYVDWYLILRVEEDAEADAIRRRFRELALQLHPDKNKHPKAEDAFKLVCEAYCCLSDKSKRRAFNLERSHRFCNECIKRQSRPTNTGHPSSTYEKKSSKSHQIRPRRTRNPHALREARRMLEEEARVIERCLHGYGATTTNEFPLFDPGECLVFPDYPHCRAEVHRDVWRLGSNCCCQRNKSCRGGRKESPIYEIRSENLRGSAFRA